MRLSMAERRKITKQLQEKYGRAGKKEKTQIVKWLVEVAGYNRAYAAMVLRGAVRRGSRRDDGRVPQVGGRRPGSGRPVRYDEDVVAAVKKIWRVMDWMCGKRLAPHLPEIVRVLEREDELVVSEQVRQKLVTVSAASVDRLLSQEKKRWKLKIRTGTKPGGLMKNQIPVRTYSQWDEKRPGYVEIDLVEHNGGSSQGDFMQTLDVTDVCTAWTESVAVRNKAQVWVFEGLREVMARMPFPILGIDSDNGSEFINKHLIRFCQANKITLTRSRPMRKNDSCYVEQKNYSVVRRAVGYWRHDTPQELTILNQLYRHLRLYGNFFLPTMKLVEKVRVGSRIRKRYDRPTTPYQRVLASPVIPQTVKSALTRQYDALNPVALKRQLTACQVSLRAIADGKKNCQNGVRNAQAFG
jgi:hypothetical protein